jgi:hypothetical protein
MKIFISESSTAVGEQELERTPVVRCEMLSKTEFAKPVLDKSGTISIRGDQRMRANNVHAALHYGRTSWAQVYRQALIMVTPVSPVTGTGSEGYRPNSTDESPPRCP